MQIDNESKTMMSAFMQDLWSFIKSNWTADANDDEYWGKLISEISKIGKKYENHPAVVHTLLGYVDYLEHEGSGRTWNMNESLNS